MAQTRTIEYILNLKDNLSVGLEKAQTNLKGLGSKMDSAGGKLTAFGGKMSTVSTGAAALGAAAAGAGIVAAKMAVDFDKGMREVATLTPDVANNFDSLKSEVLDLSSAIGVDAVEATGALYQAISAGVPADNAIDFLEVASKAAIGGVTDTETAVDGLTTVMNAFKSQNVDAQKAADVMFATVKAGKTDFAQLSASMFNVAPLAASAGVKFEEVSAAIANMTAQGVPTSVATTSIRAAIQGLLKPSDDMNALFKDLGYESAQAAIKQDGLTQSLYAVTEASGGNIGEMQKLLGSVEAVQAALVLTEGDGEAMAAQLENMENSAGAAGEAFNTMAEGPAQQWAQMVNTLKNEMIKLGTAMLPVVQSIMRGVIPVVKAISEWVQKHQTLTKAIVIFAGVLLGLVAAIAPIALMIGGLLTLFSSAAVLIGGAVVLAVAALAAGAYLLVANWETVKEFFAGLVDKMAAWWENLKGLFASGVAAVVEGFKKLPEGIAFLVGFMVQSVINYFKFLFTFWTEMVPAAIGSVINWFKQLPERIGALARSLWSNTKAGFFDFKDNLFNWARDTVEGIMQWFKDLPGRIVDAVSSAGSAAKEKLGSIMSAFGAGREAAGRAVGGPVQAGRPFIVGERGPELFVPSQTGNITPNHELGNQNVTINIEVNSEVDLPKVYEAIERHLGKKSLMAQYGATA